MIYPAGEKIGKMRSGQKNSKHPVPDQKNASHS